MLAYPLTSLNVYEKLLNSDIYVLKVFYCFCRLTVIWILRHIS